MDVVDALASEFGAGVASEGVVLQVARATLEWLGLFVEVLPLWTFALSRRIQPPFSVLANSHGVQVDTLVRATSRRKPSAAASAIASTREQVG